MKLTMKAARVNAGLTQEQIADKMNISTTKVCFWEKGRYEITPEELKRYCEIVNVNTRDILLPNS